VAEVREIADEVGAKGCCLTRPIKCGYCRGRWKIRCDQGAHLMTMSTYKACGGPAGRLIVSNDAEIAETSWTRCVFPA